jgi:hypothetical protein
MQAFSAIRCIGIFVLTFMAAAVFSPAAAVFSPAAAVFGQEATSDGQATAESQGESAPPQLLGKSRPQPTAAGSSAPRVAAGSTASGATGKITDSAGEKADEPLPPSPIGSRAPGGTLPNDHGQVWREYDLRGYTSRVTTSAKPEQAIVEWILRETGTEIWFSEPLGILSADKNMLRCYHTPEMQAVVAEVVDRFVNSQAESHMLSIRLATVGNPNWRAKAYPLLKPVAVQMPGVEAWLVSKENAAFILSDLSKRTDFREHNSPNLVIHNGQAHTISKLQPKQYVRSVRPRDGVGTGYDNDLVQLQEGYTLTISPLFSLDRKTVDAVIKCEVDQVEKLIPISIDLPGAGGLKQRVQVQVPQMVSWRLHERFRWPSDQVLLLSCGVVAAPAPDKGGAVAIVNAFTTTSGRADALLFVDCQGRAPSAPREAGGPAATTGNRYRGRY